MLNITTQYIWAEPDPAESSYHPPNVIHGDATRTYNDHHQRLSISPKRNISPHRQSTFHNNSNERRVIKNDYHHNEARVSVIPGHQRRVSETLHHGADRFVKHEEAKVIQDDHH